MKLKTSSLIKSSLILTTLVGAVQLASAQEQLPREEALKYAFAVSVDLKQLQGTPIPTDVDVKNPLAVADGEYGGMFLPESKLTAEAIAKTGDKVTAIGQLWLRNLVPLRDGQGISTDKLRIARVEADGTEVRAPQCTLCVRRSAAGGLELILLGKTTEPLVTAKLTSIDTKSELPYVLTAERDSESGQVTLTLFGKYKAQLSFTALEG